MLSFLLSLGIGFGSIDLTQLPAYQVELIAKEVMAEIQLEMHTKPSLIVTERPEPTPLGALVYANGKCVVIINTNKSAWAQWGRFLNESNRAQWHEIIASSVAHEMGHCLRESRQFVSNYVVEDDEFRGIQSTGSFGPKPEMVYKQELFADAVAVLYAKEKLGEDANNVIASLIDARERFSANDPTHNTSKMLNRLVSQNISRLEGESMGGAATRLLSAL